MQCIDQSLICSEFIEDTYQLTVEHVKHDSVIFLVTIFFTIRNKLRFSDFSLSRSHVMLDFSGNAVVINSTSAFGQFMHHQQQDVSP